jgi:diguanylate cyclase (GGDEF)-like protein
MSLLQKLTLKTKLFILSFFILMSLLIIAIIGYNNINAMKRNLDALYFGSLMPITNLNTIVTIYNDDIKDRFYQAKNGSLAPNDAAHEMSKSLTSIRALWNSYAKSYKEEKELPYVEYTTTQIDTAESYFIDVIEACYQGCKASTISHAQLLSTIQNVQEAIRNLIRYENEVAQFERHQLLNTYNTTIMRITLIILAVIAVVMVLSFLIFKSINRTQNQLKLATRELKISNKKLENASFTDSLTNLYNRRYFNMLYERELRRAKRTKADIAFMMLDIDYFKQYNDTYGHLEGDQALKSVAKTLKEVFKRPSDYVFRLGGEEFGVLIIGNEPTMAEFMASKTITAITDMQIPHASSQVSDFLSVSIGLVTTVPSSDMNDEKLLSLADKNLYRAKESGRNRFVSSGIDSFE